MIFWAYILGAALVWVMTLYWFIRALPNPEVPDWIVGSCGGALAGFAWPLVVVALGPVIAVRWLMGRQQEIAKGEVR